MHPNFGTGKFRLSKEELEDLYLNKGLSTNKIADLFDVCHGTVSKRLRQFGIPSTHRNLADLKPSPSLYYVYGVVKADGTLDHGKYGIKLGVTAPKFAESFKEALKILGLRVFSWTYSYDKWKSKPLLHYVLAHSKNLYEWLLSEPEVPEKFYKDFLRGIYESDGTKTAYQVKIVDTDLDLIKWIQKMIETLGFKTNLICQKQGKKAWGSKPLYNVYTLGGKAAVSAFLNTIKPVIKEVA